MKSAFSILSACLLLPAQLGLAAPAGTPAEFCAAAKNKAAFQKASAMSKCYQAALRNDTTVDQACLDKADAKFQAAIDKADAGGSCVNVNDAAAIGAAVDSCVADVLALTPGSAPTCSNPPGCGAESTCLGLIDNTSLDPFGLRVAQLDLTVPPVLASGIVGGLFTGAIQLNLPECNLTGTGGLNWLLKADTLADTLIVGGAQPLADPFTGYSFTNSPSVFGAAVAPVTTTLGLAPNDSFSSGSADVVLPVYLDSVGSSGFALPLRKLRMTGQLSANHECVGTYNAAGLVEPNCTPDSNHPAFLNGGTVHAAINLEDADQLMVSAIGQSLCVVLSGNAALYGDGGFPTHCKRSSGAIVFPGDYCSTTDTPGGCADSVEFSGSYAASAVKIN